MVLLELEQILVLILDHIWSTVDRTAADLFLQISAGPVVPLISVCSMCFDVTHRYSLQKRMLYCFWCVCLSVRPLKIIDFMSTGPLDLFRVHFE